MPATKLVNANIASTTLLSSPREMLREIPLTAELISRIKGFRQTVEHVLDDEDHRLLAIVGPCSIHNLEAAEEYAIKLKKLSDEVSDSICVIMRVYFEKPRTVVGWKGLINDPYMNDTFHIGEGIRMARQFLKRVAEIGLPSATEVLDPLMPQYIGDLISWSAIGARTVESQTHREIASGISTPVGLKNATDGTLTAAINGIKAAMDPHHFLGVTDEGLPAIFCTTGNPYPHLVLRGGKQPNYDEESILFTEKALKMAGVPLQIIVDCSHGNSNKQPDRQCMVARKLMDQLEQGNRSIRGFMLESNLEWGNQPMGADPSALKPGVSVTDACIDWETTEIILREVHNRHKKVIEERFTSFAGDIRKQDASM